MDYNVRYLYGPTGVLVSLVLASIRQPVVVARSQVYVAPYASGTCPNLFLFFQKKKKLKNVFFQHLRLRMVRGPVCNLKLIRFGGGKLDLNFDLISFHFLPDHVGRAGPFEACLNVTSGEEGRCMFAMVMSFFFFNFLFSAPFLLWRIKMQHLRQGRLLVNNWMTRLRLLLYLTLWKNIKLFHFSQSRIYWFKIVFFPLFFLFTIFRIVSAPEDVTLASALKAFTLARVARCRPIHHRLPIHRVLNGQRRRRCQPSNLRPCRGRRLRCRWHPTICLGCQSFWRATISTAPRHRRHLSIRLIWAFGPTCWPTSTASSRSRWHRTNFPIRPFTLRPSAPMVITIAQVVGWKRTWT